MKSLKVLIHLLLIVVLAVTVFAFANQKQNMATEAKQTTLVYAYIGPEPPTLADINNPSNWRLVAIVPCPQTGLKVCAIWFNSAHYTLA